MACLSRSGISSSTSSTSLVVAPAGVPVPSFQGPSVLSPNHQRTNTAPSDLVLGLSHRLRAIAVYGLEVRPAILPLGVHAAGSAAGATPPVPLLTHPPRTRHLNPDGTVARTSGHSNPMAVLPSSSSVSSPTSPSISLLPMAGSAQCCYGLRLWMNGTMKQTRALPLTTSRRLVFPETFTFDVDKTQLGSLKIELVQQGILFSQVLSTAIVPMAYTCPQGPCFPILSDGGHVRLFLEPLLCSFPRTKLNAVAITPLSCNVAGLALQLPFETEVCVEVRYGGAELATSSSSVPSVFCTHPVRYEPMETKQLRFFQSGRKLSSDVSASSSQRHDACDECVLRLPSTGSIRVRLSLLAKRANLFGSFASIAEAVLDMEDLPFEERDVVEQYVELRDPSTRHCVADLRVILRPQFCPFDRSILRNMGCIVGCGEGLTKPGVRWVELKFGGSAIALPPQRTRRSALTKSPTWDQPFVFPVTTVGTLEMHITVYYRGDAWYDFWDVVEGTGFEDLGLLPLHEGRMVRPISIFNNESPDPIGIIRISFEGMFSSVATQGSNNEAPSGSRLKNGVAFNGAKRKPFKMAVGGNPIHRPRYLVAGKNGKNGQRRVHYSQKLCSVSVYTPNEQEHMSDDGEDVTGSEGEELDGIDEEFEQVERGSVEDPRRIEWDRTGRLEVIECTLEEIDDAEEEDGMEVLENHIVEAKPVKQPYEGVVEEF